MRGDCVFSGVWTLNSHKHSSATKASCTSASLCRDACRVAPQLRAPRGPQHVRSVAAAAAAAAGLTAQQRRGVNQLVQVRC